MNENIPTLRFKLTTARDQAVSFITYADNMVPPEWRAGRPDWSFTAQNDPWLLINEESRKVADNLRSSVRQVMVEIAQEAQRSLLVDETDLRMLAQYAKRMAAALRFRVYKQWGINIHHDEGSYIGMDPPGQSDDEIILPQMAKNEFLECYRKTTELMELMNARKESINQNNIGSPLASSLVQSYRPGTAFIMMAIDSSKPELQDVKDVVKEVFKQFGIVAVRADEIEHSEGITNRIVEEIRTSQYLFADLTCERPSVYYEIGFAHAIGKTVLLYRKKGTLIHFDLAYRNTPEYDSIGDLRKKMQQRLTSMTGTNPTINHG